MSFSRLWFDKNVHNLEIFLSKLKGQPSLKMLEIGSFEGRSSVWWLENVLTHPDSHLTCIDTFEGSDEIHQGGIDMAHTKETFDENMKPYQGKYAVFVGKSQEILRQNLWPLESFDIVYVDGSHHADDTLEDMVLAWRLLKPNRVMMIDDYFWDHFQVYDDIPRTAIDSFIRCFRKKLQICLCANQVYLHKL